MQFDPEFSLQSMLVAGIETWWLYWGLLIFAVQSRAAAFILERESEVVVLIHLIERENVASSTNCSYLRATCDKYFTNCFLYRMPVVKPRNILFQAVGHSISEAFPENLVSGSQGNWKFSKNSLWLAPSWTSDSGNTADSLPGDKDFALWLGRRYWYELEYVKPFWLQDSLSFLFTGEHFTLLFYIAVGVCSTPAQPWRNPSLELCLADTTEI